MPLPFGSYAQGAKFLLIRPYVYDFVIYKNGNGLGQSANTFIISTPPTGFPQAVIEIDPRLWLWNSNAYTLDYYIIRSEYRTSVFSPFLDLPFSLTYTIPIATKRPTLEYRYFGLSGDPVTFHFPPQPPHWWLPKPLP